MSINFKTIIFFLRNASADSSVLGWTKIETLNFWLPLFNFNWCLSCTFNRFKTTKVIFIPLIFSLKFLFVAQPFLAKDGNSTSDDVCPKGYEPTSNQTTTNVSFKLQNFFNSWPFLRFIFVNLKIYITNFEKIILYYH